MFSSLFKGSCDWPVSLSDMESFLSPLSEESVDGVSALVDTFSVIQFYKMKRDKIDKYSIISINRVKSYQTASRFLIFTFIFGRH